MRKIGSLVLMIYFLAGGAWGKTALEEKVQQFTLAVEKMNEKEQLSQGLLQLTWEKCIVKEFRVRSKPGQRIYLPWNCREVVSACPVKIERGYAQAQAACFVAPKHAKEEKITLKKLSVQGYNGAHFALPSQKVLLSLTQ